VRGARGVGFGPRPRGLLYKEGQYSVTIVVIPLMIRIYFRKGLFQEKEGLVYGGRFLEVLCLFFRFGLIWDIPISSRG